MDSNKIRFALVVGIKLANATLGTDISMPTGLVADTIKQIELHLPVIKNTASDTVNSINKIANSFAKNPANIENQGLEQDDQSGAPGQEGEDKESKKDEEKPEEGKEGEDKENKKDEEKPEEGKEGEDKESKKDEEKPQLSSVGEMNKRPDRRTEKEDKDNKKKEGKENQEGSALTSSWHKLRNSLAKKKKKKDSAKELVEEAVNKTSRLASYEFYRQCWFNLIDSFGLTYFGLLFLFIGKYVLFSPKFVKFVSITDESVRIKVIQNKEITDIGMMIIFISFTGLIALSIFITTILVSLIIKAINLSWWGLLTNPEQFLSDLNDIYEFVKALL